MTATYDVFVVGSDEASLCAAACAARAGARVGLLRPKGRSKSLSGASVNPVPNAVWRRLDLQDFGLSLDPVSARVTLLPEGKTVSTYASARRTDDALAEQGVDDHLLWSSFLDDMAGLKRSARLGDTLMAGVNGAAPLTSLFDDEKRLSALGRITGPCTDILDDYFADTKLKTHLAAHALGTTGLGGREYGAASVLPDALQTDAWRMRTEKGEASLMSALEKACEQYGVEVYEGDLISISAESGKYKSVEFTNDKSAKARCVFFATPDAVAKAGADIAASPLAPGESVTASMRFKLRKSLTPPAGDADAIFFIIDDVDELQTARDCASDGRLPEALPIEFEFARNGDLIARTVYCPKSFREDDTWREWTGQDKQAVAARMTQRLASRISGFSEAIKKSKLDLVGAEKNGAIAPRDLVVIQPHHHNAIGEAVNLIDKVLANG